LQYAVTLPVGINEENSSVPPPAFNKNPELNVAETPEKEI
jgi:hypothetical protein